MGVQDRRNPSAPSSSWRRSSLASILAHTGLICIGVTVPMMWTRSGAGQPAATLWAAVERPVQEVFDEQLEPQRTVDPLPVPIVDAEIASLPIDPEPFPETPPREPLEAIDWVSGALRRAPLDPIFARDLELPDDEEPPSSVQESDVPLDTDAQKVSATPQAPPAPESTSAPVEVAARALTDHCPRPVYPRRAQRMGWYGTVVCSLTVRADGSVNDVRILQSSGHALLDDTVVRTLHAWRFAPATVDSVPTDSQIIRRFRFDLPS